MSVRVRIAPSPTGPLHIGTARTALFNWIYARQHNGVMILRIEDTDRERSTKEFEKSITEGLTWLGITWQEGPVRQSERHETYRNAIAILLEEEAAFYCFHTTEEREQERKEQRVMKTPFRHICEHADLPKQEQKKRIENDESFVIRFRSPEKETITFEDAIRGKVSFSTDELGHFSIAKSLDDPLYNLAVVVDDHALEITDVIRGEDHISNTPKQILLYNALGWPLPRFAHLPLILDEQKAKLSKRAGAVSVLEFREDGYLPQALINFLALLGWHPRGDEEKVDIDQILAEFKLSNVQKSAAIFDRDKLNWLNGRYIRSLPLEELEEKTRPFFKHEEVAVDADHHPPLTEVLRLVRDRMITLKEAPELSRFFFEQPTLTKKLLVWKKMENPDEELPDMLEQAITILSEVGEEAWREDMLEELLLERAKEVGDGDRGMLLWPLRAALSGRPHSPGPHEIAAVLGKEETLNRIQQALDILK